ncbi:CBS domain protein [Rubellimicrobium mesophilum DSM 19309]|uniref:CBS domain protein n=1 Tax=Rubellimicrobium mesophilum DSM 19309 TaxID=442562 RepID=A0A017HCI6_9RHOB|nr:CBS domain-containing protein [Rubellimicrobium mesophilum]EYD71494.1 CBS domain protein [Rubellimicrobium mesophilum DSM 19309]
MLVRDIMTRDVRLLAPHSTLREAARQMRDDNIGSLPVAEGDRLVGYVTDRDLVVRGLAEGFSGDTYIHDVMTDRVLYCFEDDDIEDVALNIAHNQVRRLPVLSREKRLVGIVALGDLATKAPDLSAEEALEGVSKLTR